MVLILGLVFEVFFPQNLFVNSKRKTKGAKMDIPTEIFFMKGEYFPIYTYIIYILFLMEMRKNSFTYSYIKVLYIGLFENYKGVT